MPTFSEISIECTIDFIEGDEISIITTLGTSPFEWVVTRSATGEVTTGTPTGTAGERSMINLEAAYDLDQPTGYITTQTTNTLVIQSETLGEDFLGVVQDINNTGVITITYTNYVEPPDYTVDVALTRSPHYINLSFDFDTTTSATIDLYVWSGDVTVPPSEPTQSRTKIRPTVDYAEFNVDISKLCRTYINTVPSLDISSSSQIVDSLVNNVKWLKYVASYTDPNTTIADKVGTLVAIDGYGYMQEGVNPTVPATRALTNCTFRKVNREGFILFPFLNDSVITSIDVDSDEGEINDNHIITPDDESINLVQYVNIDVSQATTDEYITITLNPGGQQFVYEIIDECKYTPLQVVFKNKYGSYDVITMFKRRDDELQVTSETFKNNYITNGSYDIAKHQIQKINIIGTETVKLNSGYISDSENVLYKELVLSDKVFFYENDSFVPVNVDTKTFKPLTRLNDRLTKYTIDFSYAFNTINNI